MDEEWQDSDFFPKFLEYPDYMQRNDEAADEVSSSSPPSTTPVSTTTSTTGRTVSSDFLNDATHTDQLNDLFEYKGGAHFRRMGTIWAGVSYEHICIRVSVKAHKDMFLLSKQIIANTSDLLATTYRRTPVLLSQLNEITKRLNRVQIEIQSKWRTFESLAQQRSKRGILGFLTGAVALGSSLYAIYEISDLKSKVQFEYEQISVNRAYIGKLEESFKLALKQQSGEFTLAGFETHSLQILTERLREAERVLGATVSAIKHGVHELFLHENMANIFSSVNAHLGSQGAFTLIDNPFDLFSVDNSYIITEEELSLFLHVPKMPKAVQSLNLFCINNNEHLFANGRDNFVGLKLHDFFAITDDNSTHVSLNAADLMQCQKRGVTYLCPHLVELSTINDTNCFSDLYTRGRVHGNCKATLIKNEPHIDCFNTTHCSLFVTSKFANVSGPVGERTVDTKQVVHFEEGEVLKTDKEFFIRPIAAHTESYIVTAFFNPIDVGVDPASYETLLAQLDLPKIASLPMLPTAALRWEQMLSIAAALIIGILLMAGLTKICLHKRLLGRYTRDRKKKNKKDRRKGALTYISTPSNLSEHDYDVLQISPELQPVVRLQKLLKSDLPDGIDQEQLPCVQSPTRIEIDDEAVDIKFDGPLLDEVYTVEEYNKRCIPVVGEPMAIKTEPAEEAQHDAQEEMAILLQPEATIVVDEEEATLVLPDISHVAQQEVITSKRPDTPIPDPIAGNATDNSTDKSAPDNSTADGELMPPPAVPPKKGRPKRPATLSLLPNLEDELEITYEHVEQAMAITDPIGRTRAAARREGNETSSSSSGSQTPTTPLAHPSLSKTMTQSLEVIYECIRSKAAGTPPRTDRIDVTAPANRGELIQQLSELQAMASVQEDLIHMEEEEHRRRREMKLLRDKHRQQEKRLMEKQQRERMREQTATCLKYQLGPSPATSDIATVVSAATPRGSAKTTPTRSPMAGRHSRHGSDSDSSSGSRKWQPWV